MKRYIDIYSVKSVIGFSTEDLLHISHLYTKAGEYRSHGLSHKDEDSNLSLLSLERQIDAYFNFLLSVAELARTKWTEFNLGMMGIGFGIILISLLTQLLAIERIKKPYGLSLLPFGDFDLSFRLIFAIFIMLIRACSFLSNSYICKFSV